MSNAAHTALINETADMIGDFDTFAANVFRNQPFQRQNIAKAFYAGFTTHSDATRQVCATVTAVANLDVRVRAAAMD